MTTLRVIVSLVVLITSGTIALAQPRKTISRPDLEDILAHSITIVSLNDYCKTPDGHYPGTYTRIVDEAEMADSSPDPIAVLLREDRESGRTIARYSDMLRLIRRLRPRMVTDVVTQWGAWDWGAHMARCRATVADIKTVDPEIVVQAAANEFVDVSTARAMGNIPAWVWEAFGLPDEHRRFDIHRMMFADWAQQDEDDVPQRWWDGAGMEDGLPRAIVPDIRSREAQMWFYHQGRVFIDMGCESINFCQVELMNNGTHDPAHWNVVFDKLRAYADTKAGIRYLLITGSTHGMRDAAGNLAFDFHSTPVRPSELGTNVDENGGDCEITANSCRWSEGAGKLYGRSVGGRTPSGWWCESLPGQVLMDNWDNSGPHTGWGKPSGDECGIYYFDEITWFALQDKAYRDRWLRYAYNRVHQIDPQIYLALPVKRNIKLREAWYPAHYLANNPAPGGLFSPPATIGNVPGGDVDRHAVQLYAGYGQEDVIQEILLAGPSLESELEMHVTPNPGDQWVGISLTQPGPASIAKYAVINIVGAQVAAGAFRGSSHRIDASALPRGLYFLTVWDGSKRHAAKVLLRS